jgi:predicted transcriptional regulator
MAEMRLGAVESHFADIVWEHAPLTTRELTVLCEKELNWKRTTTYTVLKKMCNRGIFRTENSVVSVLISKEEFYSIQSQQFVEENFCGSLPAFIAAFTSRHAPTDKELSEIKEMIALYEEQNR